MDRRETLKWLAAVVSYTGFGGAGVFAAETRRAQGYGTDPSLSKIYKPGDVWPLTLTPAQRELATKLCDIIIPADAHSPSASSVGVVDFIDEWISAPYPGHADDRTQVLEGLKWIEEEADRRFKQSFLRLDDKQVASICDDVCNVAAAQPEFRAAAAFFASFRDLTAAGFYTTPVGRKDLNYIGNVPLPAFEGPPLEVLRAVGLA
jgi:hypothetical protein